MRHFNSKIKKYLSTALNTKNILKIKSNFSTNEKKVNSNQNFINKTENKTEFSPNVNWYQSEEIYLIPPYIGYTLLLIDFDVPYPDKDYYVHWFIPFIPKDINNIPEMKYKPNEQFFKLKKLKIKNGINSSGNYGYLNPCPPKKSGTHHYYLFIFGVKEVINSNNFEDFLHELEKINSFGCLVGKYSNDIKTSFKPLKSQNIIQDKYIVNSQIDNSKSKKSIKKKKKKIGGMYTDSGLKVCHYKKIGYDDQGAHSLDPIYQVSQLNALPFNPNHNTC